MKTKSSGQPEKGRRTRARPAMPANAAKVTKAAKVAEASETIAPSRLRPRARPTAKRSSVPKASGPKAEHDSAPSSADPRAYHHGDLRRALLDATKAIVEDTGPELFTLREAARRAGVNHRAAYRHFEDKSELLAAVAEEGYTGLEARVRERLFAVSEDDTYARLVMLARSYVEFASENRGTYRVMAGPRLNGEGRFPGLEAAIGKNLKLVRAEIQRGMDLGNVPGKSSFDATLALWASVHGLSTLVIYRRVQVRPELVGSFTERLLGGLLTGFVKRD